MPTGLFVGLATLDVVQFVDAVPAANQKTTARESWLAAGGPAAVAAIAFASLGGHARLLTVLGTGAAADVVRADLATAGVEVVDAAPSGFGIAPSVALVGTDGNRAVVSGSGHQPDAVQCPELDLGDVDVVLLDGHHPELARAAGRAAAGLPVVVDAGSHKSVFDELWPQLTDVICSADYVHPSGERPAALLARGPHLVAVSHGSDPVMWWTPHAFGEVPAPSVPVVDTLGAGDVLHGAYCYALTTGRSRRESLEFAVAAASRRVCQAGPFAWREALRHGFDQP
ncbi:MAG: PfkB family carbohydrate kinase [Propionicimonas sp.]|uniref:PfkB family carbohydrate kinase n=1 Tax=Propionicimonas sp. TaxID=1955623 RepID=UPI002B21B388|nr:PfkB family carbohydrate kinase [Propionicimonas sp.]MEA4944918.1 PfkB family carbohydrate kinase [Propionicimonas sp.]